MWSPAHVVTNEELAQEIDTTDEWIRSRTGIERRHIASDQETTAQMAIEASRAALQVADADPRDIDLIILCTATPNHSMPATACIVQNALDATRAGAFDLNAGCSGFTYGLAMGQQAIASGEHDLVLVVGAETMSRIVDWQDRATCVLFGDGAGAVLLKATEGDTGVLATVLGSDGAGADFLIVPAGGSALPTSAETLAGREHYLRMEGREVYRFATQIVPRAVQDVTRKAGLALSEVDLVVPHQANLRIIGAAAKKLDLPLEKFVTNLEEYGNTSAASIPIALCEAISQGRVQQGQNLVFIGFGAGLTWAAVALRWGVSPQQVRGPFYHNWLRWLLYRWAAARTRIRRVARRLTVLTIRRTRKPHE